LEKEGGLDDLDPALLVCNMSSLRPTALVGLVVGALASSSRTHAPMSKSIDMYANFPSRLTDFVLGNNTQVW